MPNTSLMRKILVGLCVLLGAYEVVALLDNDPGDTISASTRALFHTHTLVGRLIWLAVWGTFSSWFAYHIAKWHVEEHRN